MFQSISCQWCALCVLLSLALSGTLPKNKAEVVAMLEDPTLLEITESDKTFSGAQHGAIRQLSCDKPSHESKDSPWLDPKTRSSLKRIPGYKKISTCKMSDVVDSMMPAVKIKSPVKPSSLWSKGSSPKPEHLEIPVFKRLQSLQEGRQASEISVFNLSSPDGPSPRTVLSSPIDKRKTVRKILSRIQSEPSPSREFLWPSLASPRKTVVWSTEVLERAPSGQKVVERYIEDFNAEAFTQYIADEETKSKQPRLSILKKLTEANENTTPNQFAQLIHVLEPTLRVHNIEANISDFFQPAFAITRKLKESTAKIIFETLKEYRGHYKTFSKPKQNSWMLYRSLKDRLYEQAEGEFIYDLLSLEQVINKIFKAASGFKMINDEVLQEISDENFLSILLARLPIPKGHQNLTEEKALYIRQCLGSVYAFTLRYKSFTTKPLPKAINGYYSKIYHRYSDCPELRHFAEKLHEEHNAKFAESERHDLTEITLDNDFVKE